MKRGRMEKILLETIKERESRRSGKTLGCGWRTLLEEKDKKGDKTISFDLHKRPCV